jgi:hypothetical protein
MRATVLCMAALALTALAASSGSMRADRGSPVVHSCPDAPEVRYFPVNSFRPHWYPRGAFGSHWSDADLFVRQWYSSHLAAMEEPSLSCGTLEDAETYRFLWLRSFHNPVAVRVFRRGDDYGLQAVVLDGTGGNEPGKVSRRVTKELSGDQVRAVVVQLVEMRFWRMRADTFNGGLDGAQWIVEGRRDGRYNVVDRWSGTDAGVEAVGKHFLDLAGLSDVGPVY